MHLLLNLLLLLACFGSSRSDAGARHMQPAVPRLARFVGRNVLTSRRSLMAAFDYQDHSHAADPGEPITMTGRRQGDCQLPRHGRDSPVAYRLSGWMCRWAVRFLHACVPATLTITAQFCVQAQGTSNGPEEQSQSFEHSKDLAYRFPPAFGTCSPRGVGGRSAGMHNH
jgi:hypothetical protein